MVFTAHAPGVFAAHFQHALQNRICAVGCRVGADGFFGNLKYTDTTDLGSGAVEVFFYKGFVQAHGFKNL